MAEQEPHIIFDEEANEPQRRAIGGFLLMASKFSETEILAATEITDRYQGALDTMKPLTRSPEELSELSRWWSAITETRAFEVVEFDEATEDAIAEDKRVKDLKSRRHVNTQERDRSEMLRLRFAIFSGRKAVALAKKASKDNEVIEPTESTDKITA